jgi:hypothetical protein
MARFGGLQTTDLTLIRPTKALQKSGTMPVFRETEARSADFRLVYMPDF